jgi:hypothetical protein
VYAHKACTWARRRSRHKHDSLDGSRERCTPPASLPRPFAPASPRTIQRAPRRTLQHAARRVAALQDASRCSETCCVAAPRVASRPSESRRAAPRCVAALRDASCLYLGVCRDGWRDEMSTCVRETGLRARVCTVPDQTCHIMYHHLNARYEAASDHGPERRLAFSAGPYAHPFAESWKRPKNSDLWHQSTSDAADGFESSETRNDVRSTTQKQ